MTSFFRLTAFAMLLCLWPAGVWSQNNDEQGPILELEARITGSREQPQVFHIVPWQNPDSPMPDYDPLQSQLQDVFGHLEREELRRSLEQSEAPD